MKAFLKNSFTVFLAAVMLLSSLPFYGVVMNADAAACNGECGENVTWSFDAEKGVLTVSGNGEMFDYAAANKTPWFSYASEIDSVVISEGVRSIGNNAFYGLEMSSVTVPASVEIIGLDAFGWCFYLESINVASANSKYSSDENGVLYNYDKTVLIKYPSGKKTDSFIIPDGVTSLEDYAFENCYVLSDVTISSTVADIGNGSFFNCYLENIIVDSQNSSYSSVSGVLFNKDKSSLILYPCNNSRTNYSIPDSVTEIESSAFHNNVALRSIVMPDGVKRLGDEAFLYCESLEYLHVSEHLTEIGVDVIDSTYAHFCSYTENCYAMEYAAENGYDFVVCEGHGVADIILSDNEIEIKNKSSHKISATVLPENADDKSVVWSSDNENVVTVDENGFVTAVSVGTANITATANDGGKCAVCKVTVIPRKFRITWVVDGVETVKYQDEESQINILDDPYKIGYNFIGWTPCIPDAMPPEDLTFIAQFSIGTYKAVFYAEGGKWLDGAVEKTVTTVYQNEILVPENPERTGYKFAGWTPQIPDAMPARYLEFIAEWIPESYDAVFDANGGEWNGGATEKIISADFDAQIFAPESPVKQGYIFDGWTPEVGIMDDINGKIFNAKWIPASDTGYTVEFYTMQIGGEYSVETKKLTGTTDEEVSVEYNIENGFVLNEKMSILSGVVSADGSLVLKVYFDRLKSVVSVNGINIECWFGEVISEPEKPEAPEGYVQSGWVDENGNTIDFPFILTDAFPKEIKAKFIVNSFTVKWNVDGVITSETYFYQAEISRPATPVKDGYIFKGWTPEIPDFMPAYNIEFTAVFERIVYICPDCKFETFDENEYSEHMAYEKSKKDVRISIINNPGTAKIKYGETLKLTAITTIDVADTKIFWFVDGVKKGEGDTFSITFEKGTKTVEAKIVDSSGTVLKTSVGDEISDSQKVTVNSGFWQKIVSFFKNLFGVSRIVVQYLHK